MVDTASSHPGFERSSPDEDIEVESTNEAKISDRTSRTDTPFTRAEQTPPQAYHGRHCETKIDDPFAQPYHHYRTSAIKIPVCELSALRRPLYVPFPSTHPASRYAAGNRSASLATGSDNECVAPTFTITAPYCTTETIPRVFEEETPLLRSVTPDPELSMSLGIDSGVEIQNGEQVDAHFVFVCAAIDKRLKKATCLETPALPQQPFVCTPGLPTSAVEARNGVDYKTTFVDIPDYVFGIASDPKASGEDMVVDLECARYVNTSSHANSSIPAGAHSATDYSIDSSEDNNTDTNTDSDTSIFDVDGGYGSNASSYARFGNDSNPSAIHQFNKYPNFDSPKSYPQDHIAPVLTTTHADGTRQYIPSDGIPLAKGQPTVYSMSYANVLVILEASSQDDESDSGYASGCDSDVDEFYLASQYPDVLDESSSDGEYGRRDDDESSGREQWW